MISELEVFFTIQACVKIGDESIFHIRKNTLVHFGTDGANVHLFEALGKSKKFSLE